MIFFPFISSIMAWEPIDDGGSPISWSNGNPETQWRMSSSYPSSSMNWSTAESKLSNGINEWSQPGCTSFNASQISDTNASPLNWEDSDNTVGFLGSGWPAEFGSGTLAVTLPYYVGSEIIQSDMAFNEQDFYFINGSPSDWEGADLESVAVHEF